MITFTGYFILHPTPSETRELRLMPSLSARFPSRVDVCLCIIPIESFLMVWFAPPTWASDRCVSVFNVEPARVTYVPVCKCLCDVRVHWRLCCWLANYSCSAWCNWDPPVATSTLTLRLVLQVVCERRALATSAAATLSTSPSSSSTSSTTHVECVRLCGACVRYWHRDR